MAHVDDLPFVIDIARRAGAVALARFGNVERQTKASPGAAIKGWQPIEAVTEADRACQRLIVSALRERFPDDGVIGEESDDGSGITNRAPSAGARIWVIDPIDGTNNYVAGFGAFAVCIALVDHGRPVIGVVHDPCRGQTYAGADGAGAWLDDRPTRALDTALSDRSLVMLTCNFLDREGALPGFITRWLTRSSWKFRMLGTAALEAVQVGAGVAHGAITINGKLWDVAAAAAIVLAAGGRVTDLSGTDVFPYLTDGYRGAKVPFVAAGPCALGVILADIQQFGWPSPP
ncbi:MAG: inositol monophosphatase [Planctomycetes bacterium]|nr:inositol monophosphatase [Planctomycetota bacterium]